MQEYEFHEAANIFPLDEENLDSLAKDIEANGLHCPIELFEGKIIDGRRRYTACQSAGFEPDIVEVKPEDPIAYVLSLNLHRRHLTPSQSAMCAQRARKMYDDAAKERRKESGKMHGRGQQKVPNNCTEPISKGDARDQVGKAFGVSGGSVDRARRVIEKNIPELAEAVDAGKITVARACEIARFSDDPNKVKEVLNEELNRRQNLRRPSKKEKYHPESDNGKEEIKPQGVGMKWAAEAINCLKKIPRKDKLRKLGLKTVADWISYNK